MKITADLILQCSQFTNAVKDRELDLRGKTHQEIKFLFMAFKVIWSQKLKLMNC